MSPTEPVLDALLRSRLSPDDAAWWRAAAQEMGAGVSAVRLAGLLAQASRHAPRTALAPSRVECGAAAEALPGWSPERWSTLEALRVRLLLHHAETAGPDLPAAVEECFRYADVGETTALYRSLAHLPRGERFVWRAGEGCRTNMRPVFEAVACDTPYPARHFDETAWTQLVLKAVFIGAPLWRVHGVDQRLSPELARMALDLADERRSAGRSIQPELWLCLGDHGGVRGLRALEEEMSSPDRSARRAAALGLGRAGADAPLRARLPHEPDPQVRATIEAALAGRCEQTAFAVFESGRN